MLIPSLSVAIQFYEGSFEQFPFYGTFYLGDSNGENTISFVFGSNWLFLFAIAINDSLDVNHGVSQEIDGFRTRKRKSEREKERE